MIERNCRENLVELQQVVQLLTKEEYSKSLQLFSGASIGQHVRHILEFYICLMKGKAGGTVNYDQRERDIRIEEDQKFALYTIDKLRTNLPCGSTDTSLKLSGNFSSDSDEQSEILTSFFRELAYCLEHSIHHQALIKIGLIELKRENIISDTFGVAPATIRFKSVG